MISCTPWPCACDRYPISWCIVFWSHNNLVTRATSKYYAGGGQRHLCTSLLRAGASARSSLAQWTDAITCAVEWNGSEAARNSASAAVWLYEYDCGGGTATVNRSKCWTEPKRRTGISVVFFLLAVHKMIWGWTSTSTSTSTPPCLLANSGAVSQSAWWREWDTVSTASHACMHQLRDQSTELGLT